MSLTFKVTDTATAQLDQIRAQIAPGRRRGLMLVLGRQAQTIFRSHFRSREADSPNKKGWPRQHFWSGVAKVTALDSSQTTDSKAVVAISSPAFAAKVHGATILPTGGRRMLAIPMRAEAYGVRPSSGIIPGLVLLGGKSGGALYLGKRAEGGFKNLMLYFRLVPRVTVRADSRALPSVAHVESELMKTASSFLERSMRRT